jgi:3D (Asp-Asp-Asp) domain-containing protein
LKTKDEKMVICKLLAILIVTATVYNAVPEQTDSTPFITASGAQINKDNPEHHRWVAVSQDMLKRGYKFGMCIEVQGAGDLDGVWEIQDVMNKRYTNSIDFLVENTRKLGKWKGVKIKLIS